MGQCLSTKAKTFTIEDRCYERKIANNYKNNITLLADCDEKKMEECYRSGDECAIEIRDLNDDELLEIFSYLDVNQRIAIERVCKRWKVLVEKSLQTITTLAIKSKRNSDNNNNSKDMKVSKRCQKSAEINFVNKNGFKDEMICYLLSKFAHIDTLTMVNLKFNTSPFTVILQSFQNQSLHYLEIKNCQKFNQYSNCIHIDDKDMEAFTNRFQRSLKHLIIKSKKSFSISYNSLSKLFEYNDLETLSLHNVECYGKIGDCFQYSNNRLRSIKISRNILNNDGLVAFVNNRAIIENLRVLKIKPGIILPEDIALISGKLKRIEKFHCNVKIDNPIDDLRNIRSLSSLTNLADLHLHFSIAPTEDFCMDQALFELMEKCPKINYLLLDGFNVITDMPLARIAHYWPNLEELTLKCISTITDDIMPCLAQLYFLRLLNLRDCANVSNGVLRVIQMCDHLNYIDLRKTNLNENTIASIVEIISKRQHMTNETITIKLDS